MKILVPVDGSASAMKALETACDWAKSQAPAEVILLAAVPSFSILEEGRYMTEKFEKQAEAALAQAKSYLQGKDLPHRTLIATGLSPADEIVEAANKEKADMIIMGTRGLGAKTKSFLGSTAAHVVATAPCSVLVVKSSD